MRLNIDKFQTYNYNKINIFRSGLLMEYLYKFVNFEGLINIIKNENLLFQKPSSWVDKRENIIVNCFNCKEAFDILLAEYRKQKLNNKSIIMNLAQLNIVSNYTYAICFTNSRNRDSAAMWQIYGKKEEPALRLKFDKSFINTLNPAFHSGKLNFYHSTMNYVKSIKINKIVQQQIELSRVNPMFYIKSSCFKFEKETRIIAVPWSNKEDFLIKAALANYNILVKEDISFENMNYIFNNLGINNFNNEEKIYVGFNKQKLISVQVDPSADKYYLEKVKCFCESNNIVFEGKSNLYDIPFT